MITKTKSGLITHLLTAILASTLLLSACTPAVSTPALPDPTAAPLPTATVPAEAPTATAIPEATSLPTEDGSLHFTIDTGSLATGYQTETVAAVSADSGAPIREVLPEHTRVTLQGYVIGSHAYQPQIFIYPVAELVLTNESAAVVVATLQTLIQSPQEVKPMPFLPLMNQVEVIHAGVQYLDFQNGQGLRYLAEFGQGISPLNNYELIYTYQGLTSDGKYSVAAVLPVNHPSLPAERGVTGNEPLEFSSDFAGYKANLANTLNTAAADTFTPDLTQLDAMMSSLKIGE